MSARQRLVAAFRRRPAHCSIVVRPPPRDAGGRGATTTPGGGAADQCFRHRAKWTVVLAPVPGRHHLLRNVADALRGVAAGKLAGRRPRQGARSCGIRAVPRRLWPCVKRPAVDLVPGGRTPPRAPWQIRALAMPMSRSQVPARRDRSPAAAPGAIRVRASATTRAPAPIDASARSGPAAEPAALAPWPRKWPTSSNARP
jgi:hypothetical protein